MKKSLTKGYGYKPTKAEQKLLEVLLNPNSIGKSVTAMCREAGVSTKVYYTGVKKEGFNDLVRDVSIELIKGKIAHVINATYENALEPKGFQDRKMILAMANAYTDKVEHEGSFEIDIKVDWADDDD